MLKDIKRREPEISLCCAHIPVDKQVWFILNKTLQVNTVVLQSFFSFHTVTVKEPDSYVNCTAFQRRQNIITVLLQNQANIY